MTKYSPKHTYLLHNISWTHSRLRMATTNNYLLDHQFAFLEFRNFNIRKTFEDDRIRSSARNCLCLSIWTGFAAPVKSNIRIVLLSNSNSGED